MPCPKSRRPISLTHRPAASSHTLHTVLPAVTPDAELSGMRDAWANGLDVMKTFTDLFNSPGMKVRALDFSRPCPCLAVLCLAVDHIASQPNSTTDGRSPPLFPLYIQAISANSGFSRKLVETYPLLKAFEGFKDVADAGDDAGVRA